MDYIVDVENKRLVSGFRSTRTSTPESAVFGDTPTISVRLVESNESGNEVPWRYVDLTGYSIRVALGNPGGDPTSGTFTLTFDGDTTAALDFDATAAEVDTALNALASMVTAGGCTVTQVTAGYQVAFDSTGDQSIITATTDSLFPASSAYIYEATTGDGSTNEVQVITLEVDNSAYVELTTDIAAPAATVTVVREGVTDTTSELQRVDISGDPYLGTWAVTIGGNTSSAISVDASLEDITTAIEGITGIGAGNVTVTGSTLNFTLQFAASLGNVATASIDVTNLTGSVGKTGSIDFNTNQFLELLGGAASASATLEIVKYNTGNSTSDTVYQGSISCVQDVIANTPASATPFPTYAAASHTHEEADINNLGTAITLNADTNLTGNGWFLDEDTLVSDDAEKVPSQQSVKAYVDTQISGLGSVMEFKGSYDATGDPTDGSVGDSYVVTVGGTGAASFWSSALEVGDLIIQENDPATTEADWVVVSRDIIPATETTAGVVELATQAETDAGADTSRVVTPATLSNYPFPATALSEASATIYVSKDGNDSDDGLTIEEQKLTIGSAITAAATLITGGADGVFINVLDGGEYTENLVIEDAMHLQAPAATLVGTLALQGSSSATVDKHYTATGSSYCVNKPNSGFASYSANLMDTRGTGGALTGGSAVYTSGTVSSATLSCYIGQIFLGASAKGVNHVGTGSNNFLNAYVGVIHLAGNSSTGVATGNTGGNIHAQIGRIAEASWLGSYTTTEGVKLDGSGSNVWLTAGEINADTAHNIVSGNLYLSCPSITGTLTGTPAGKLMADLSDDATPTLGGNLNLDTSYIYTSPGVDINLLPGGTGNVNLGNFEFNADQTVGAGQDNYVLTYDNGTGEIGLTETNLVADGTSIMATSNDITGDGSSAINFRLGNYINFTFGAQNENPTWTYPTEAGAFYLRIKQDSVGGRTITWSSIFNWPGGTAPTLSTAGDAVDLITLYWDGTADFYCTYDLNFS